jgi:predicted amidohydrolase
VSAVRVGALAWLVLPAPGVAAWAERLEEEVAHAARQGAHILLMPEYAPLECAVQRVPDIAAELKAACALSPLAVDAAREIARAHNVWLMPGTMLFRVGERFFNRAPLISPDGRVAYQDKHRMTRFESERWRIDAGQPPQVFDTDYGRIGISICYDVQFSAHVRSQTEAGAWLILAPSCTDTEAGANRVRIAARARAMESQCFVAVAPTVGDAPEIATLDENRGVAGIYGPVDRGFRDDGIVDEGEANIHGWVFADLDPARIAEVRENGAVRNHRDHPEPLPPAQPAVFA